MTPALVAVLSLQCLLVWLPPCESARFRFGQAFSSHMVLAAAPRNASLWGYATPQATVSIEVDGVHAGSARANGDGLWRVVLPARPPSTRPTTVAAIASDLGASKRLLLEDVVWGLVWLCSGLL